jgi:3-oxoacyl-[acyl-carrier protein] reductase
MSKRVVVLGGSGALGTAVVAALSTRAEVESPRIELTDAHEIDRVIRAYGPIDALVHCAAVASTCTPPAWESLADVDLDGFDRLFAVNVKSAFVAARAASITGGNIVFVGSIGGGKSVPAPAPYAASKAALSGLAASLAKELGPKRTCVNVIAPGLLEGGLSKLVPERLRNEYLKHCARKRFGKIDEAAAVIAHFALDNTYVTGRTIAVDGGM